MNRVARMILGGAALFAAHGAARADETIRWLHVEVNPTQVGIWQDAARAFEAGHPGVKVEPQYLENEAYKSKLTTMLQSRDKPAMFYSWAGGVLQAQVEAGVVEDLTPRLPASFRDSITPTALSAFTVNGKVYGVPQALTEVGFLFNKALFAKAGVDPD
jgi:raffinose/stachyose/melibiose transport system substrate-binding protein